MKEEIRLVNIKRGLELSISSQLFIFEIIYNIFKYVNSCLVREDRAVLIFSIDFLTVICCFFNHIRYLCPCRECFRSHGVDFLLLYFDLN